METNYKLTANRLRKAMNHANTNAAELARKSGVLKSSISQFVNARGRPSRETADKLGASLGVNPAWLLGYNVLMLEGVDQFANISNLSTPAAHPLPIIGEICAGNGIDCEENFTGLFFVDRSIKADYCLNVSGDSMKDANIHDGDIAFIKKTETFEKGKIYAVLVCGENTASLKRIHESGDFLILSPCNKDFEPTICRKEDALIIGECIGNYHKQNDDTTSEDAVPSVEVKL